MTNNRYYILILSSLARNRKRGRFHSLASLDNKKHIKGFTLLETLIAILILMLAITGPLTIAQKGLAASQIAKDQMTGYFLAQDAVEYVRYLRDTACLTAGRAGTSPCPSSTWLSGGSLTILSTCTTPSPCWVDSIEDKVTSCGASCPRIMYDKTSGQYGYVNGVPTPFTRTISITTAAVTPGTNEATIKAVVSWVGVGGVSRSVTVLEDMFNWE